MGKAEEKAEKAYPAWRNGIGDEFSQNSAYYGFIEGYQQAEKDLELTWEDLATIKKLGDDFVKHNHTPMSDEECYKEVLKRFKEYKVNKQ